jgi:hypothetical protein
VRLQLLVEESEPTEWLRAAAECARQGLPQPDVAALLAHLRAPGELELAATVREAMSLPATLLLSGGEPDRSLGATMLGQPFLDAPALVPIEPAGSTEAADEILARAVRALGGERRLAAVHGYAGNLHREGALGPNVDETIWFAGPRLRRLQRILATRIETVIGPEGGSERAGDTAVELSATECETLLQAAARHPLIVLAEHVRGSGAWGLVSIRKTEDREIAILERLDPARERLRLHVDVESGLVRTIEADEWRQGLGRVSVREELADYRSVEGMRAPFHWLVSVGDSAAPLQCVWSEFTLRTPEAPALRAGGPDTVK